MLIVISGHLSANILWYTGFSKGFQLQLCLSVLETQGEGTWSKSPTELVSKRYYTPRKISWGGFSKTQKQRLPLDTLNQNHQEGLQICVFKKHLKGFGNDWLIAQKIENATHLISIFYTVIFMTSFSKCTLH